MSQASAFDKHTGLGDKDLCSEIPNFFPMENNSGSSKAQAGTN